MDLEAELLKSLSKEQLDSEVASRVASFHGFLTREVALRLIARDRGLLKSEEKAFRIGEIPPGEKRIVFSGRVKWVWPVALYSSGKRSRVVEIEDETGAKPLVLWNEDVGLASGLRLKDEIRVRGAYEKGGELHLGHSGAVELLKKAAFSDLAGLCEGEHVHLRGIVARIEGADRFVRGARTERGFSFILTDGTAERRCVMFEGLGRGERIREGDEMIIEGGVVAGGNVELGAGARVLTRRSGEMLIGEVESLECDGESLRARIGGKDAVMDRASALRLLKAEAAPDILLSTVVSLKKRSLLNTRIALRVENRDGLTIVR